MVSTFVLEKKVVCHGDPLPHSDSMWPEGCRAPPSPERSETTKHITRVIARAKLLGSMPGNINIL